MRILILKYLNIMALMAFLAWFLWPHAEGWIFEWEPLIGIILTLAGYIGIEAKDHSQSHASDIKLFEEFSGLFPRGSIAFFRDHDFHLSFLPEPMQKLFHYVDNWTTIEHEFINRYLQKAHRIFRKKAIEFANALSEKTTTNKNGHATVAPSHHPGGPLPDWAIKQAKDLNMLAAEFAQAHQEFIKKVRRVMH